MLRDRKILSMIDAKVDEVIAKATFRSNGFVETDSIIQAVSEITNTEIEVDFVNFSEFKQPSFNDYGAIMSVRKPHEVQDRQRAHIMVNTEKDTKFQRFSLVHELGHLALDRYNIAENANSYMLCAHIRYDVTSIPEEDFKNDKFMEAEEMANVFALKVLMPTQYFADRLFELKDFSAIADVFGLTDEAICSRALLGS